MGVWFGNEAPRCAERAHPGAGGRQEGDSGHRRVRKGRDPSQRCLDWMEYDQSDDIDQATKNESIFRDYEQLKGLAGMLIF